MIEVTLFLLTLGLVSAMFAIGGMSRRLDSLSLWVDVLSERIMRLEDREIRANNSTSPASPDRDGE